MAFSFVGLIVVAVLSVMLLYGAAKGLSVMLSLLGRNTIMPNDNGSYTCKTSTLICVVCALLVPLWPISAPLFLLLAYKTYKEPK